MSFLGSLSTSSLRRHSGSESEWRKESIIVQNPLPVILEGKEMFPDIESNYEESVFGDNDMQSENIIKVNLAAIDDM